MKFNKTPFIVAIIIASILLFPSVLQAKDISLKEAIEWGIEHNYDLEGIRNTIDSLEQNLKILDADKAFQVDLDVTPVWDFGAEKSNSSLLTLKAEKTIADNLNISAEISWNKDDFEDMSFEGIASSANASIQVEKQIYPDSYTQNEQQIFQTENDLKKKAEELSWKEAEKQIDFIESYLALIRLKEEVNIADKKLQLATEELKRVQQQISLGEGGYQQETEAKIALMEAENQSFNLKQNLIQQQNKWYLELNLSKDIQIQFEEEPAYLQTLRSNMEQLNLESEKQEILFNQALEKNYQIKNTYLEKEVLLKEAVWTENEGKPQVNINGGYDFLDNYWYAMLDLSWNIADGGAQKLKEEGARTTILQKEKELEQLTKILQLEMNQIIDQDQYNQLNLQAKLAALEKEKSTKNILEKQYQEKVISSTQWQNQLIALEEQELKVKEARDLLLVNRLRLAHFLDI
ncbi:MAG TPA: hypothetical protein ENO17_05150 [Candidatus Atribacteria bacterium]|nr:hypothetical protein [Candidatus Atribacteria bacterium]